MQKRNKNLLIAALVLLTYWMTTKVVDVYEMHPTAGAIYELTAILAILAVLATFVLPIVAIVFWIKSKFAWKKQYILPLLVSVITIFVMIFVPFLFEQSN